VSGKDIVQDDPYTTHPGFVDRSDFNYRLAANSPAIDAGVAPHGVPLTPRYQYLHRADREERYVANRAVDMGAYEFAKAR
jgi:hypothetical protein